MKKILSVLLAMVMLSGCTVTASAAEDMPLQLVYSTMRESENPVGNESNTLTVSALIKNNSSVAVTDAQIVVALYENDRLFDVAQGVVSIGANSSANTNFTFTSDLGSDMYREFDTKFFVWDGLDSVKPLANANESKYSTINYFTTSELKPWLSTLHLTTDEEAQAGELGGEGGQQVYSIAVSPFNRNIALIGTDTVGVYKTTDGGRNWRSASSGLNYGKMNDMTYDALNENVVYAVEGGPSAGSSMTGVYKSTDNGGSWTLDLNVHYTLSQLGGGDQLKWQTVNGSRYLYAATMGDGIWRKVGYTANGAWQQVYSGAEVFTDIYTDDTGLIVGVGYITVTNDDGTTENQYRLVKSTNNGTSFTTSEVTIDGERIDITSLEVSPEDSNLWVANDLKCIYKSTDAGATWSLVKRHYADTKKSTLRALRFTGYKADGASYPRLYISLNQVSCALQYSDNLGETKTKTKFYESDGTPHSTESFWAESFDIPGDDGVMYMMHDGFASSTDGGTTWTSIKAKGFSGTPMTDIEFSDDNKFLWMSSIDAGIWRAEDIENNGSVTPTIKQHNFPRFDGEGGYVQGSMSSGGVEIDPNDPNHLIAITGNYGYGGSTAVIQSYDGGASWATILDAEGNAISENLGVGNVRYSPVDDNVIFAGPLRSTDNGKTWEFISKIPYDTTDSETGETVTAYKTISVSDVSYSGKLLGYFKETSDRNIYISEDNGDSWTAHHTGTWSISALTFDIFDDNYVWLSKYNTLQKFDTRTNTGVRKLENVYSIRHFAQNPNDPNHMLVTRHDYSSVLMRNNTVYETYDGCQTWHEIEGFNYMSNPGALRFHPTEPYVYISTYLGTQVLDYQMHRAYIEAMAE